MFTVMKQHITNVFLILFGQLWAMAVGYENNSGYYDTNTN